MQQASLGVAALQQFGDTVVVGVCVCAQVGSVLKITTLFRGLQQQRGGELRSVEMPIQRLAGPVGDDVGTGQRVRHDIQSRPAHGGRQEIRHWRVFIYRHHQATRHLIGTHRVVGGLHLAQCWVIGRQAGNFWLKVDVVTPLVQVRVAGHHWRNFSRCLGCHTRSQKSLQAEHATLLQCSLRCGHHVVPGLAALTVQGVTVQVDDVSQTGLLSMNRPILLRNSSGL